MKRSLTPKRFGEANQFVGDLFNSFVDFFVADVLAIESAGNCKSESRNNDATKIEHEAIGIGHD